MANKLHKNNTSKFISYSFEANSFAADKIPPYTLDIINMLKNTYKDLSFIEVGKKIKLKSTINHINESILFIGIDNGVSHLCRCLNTPHVILEHNLNIERGFPKNYHTYTTCKSIDDLLKIKFI